MPLVASAYRPGMLYRNGHVSTIYSAVLRKVDAPDQVRERISLPDGDFLDLDWTPAKGSPGKVLLLLHGLEGNTQRPYMLGAAKLFAENGYEVCAVNFRGCSGEPNRRFRSYHSGATEDLEAVLRHVLETRAGARVYLKGFSLGGNLILKFLGEHPRFSRRLAGAAVISVPCDLHDSLRQLEQRKNWPYARRFLSSLRAKAEQKQRQFPDRLSKGEVENIRTLKDFDDFYTSRAHGFKDALDYYQKCSSKQFLPGIALPTLLLNARNDSFLGPACYPVAACRSHPRLHLEIPAFGGHVGFVGTGAYFYSELRSLEFLDQCG